MTEEITRCLTHMDDPDCGGETASCRRITTSQEKLVEMTAQLIWAHKPANDVPWSQAGAETHREYRHLASVWLEPATWKVGDLGFAEHNPEILDGLAAAFAGWSDSPPQKANDQPIQEPRDYNYHDLTLRTESMEWAIKLMSSTSFLTYTPKHAAEQTVEVAKIFYGWLKA